MKKRFTDEQIVGILRQAEAADVVIRNLCRQHGITEQTFFRWRRKYEGAPLPPQEIDTAAGNPRVAEDSPLRRVPLAQRRAQILDTAYQFFSEHGIRGDTRALAKACGISQRLLYRAFPNKAALLDALYETHVIGPVKTMWLDQLRDRSKPVEERLVIFCLDYYESVLTSRWLRTILSASLAGTSMASDYFNGFVAQLVDITMEEVAYELGLEVPASKDLAYEIGWMLYGAISHHAFRHHVYGIDKGVPIQTYIALQVRCFLSGIKTILPPTTA
ncbi:transposase [Massilia sp. LXY-6]|uniref:transposase n=1 Tax=Massilia sp. LXY-6 TaxID=3379823 RepID=UPI003EE0A419